MKARIRWTETTTYEVTIDTELTPIQLRELSGDGEGQWFAEVDNAVPDWPTTATVEITDRELDEIEIVETCSTCGAEIDDTQAKVSRLRADGALSRCKDCITRELTQEANHGR